MSENLDLEHLRRVAEAATPGPWEVVPDPDRLGPVDVMTAEDPGSRLVICEHAGPDSAHIAAFDPPTVLALIDRLEAAEAKVARVEALADRMDARRSNFWVFPTNQMPLRLPSADLREALNGDLTSSEDDGGPEGHRDDDNAGDGRCEAQEGKR